MGMYDNIKCDYPLEGGVWDEVFQTKSFGDGFTGGFLDDYTITAEGELVLHKTAWEVVPEQERPYWGKPEWDKNPLMQVAGSMKSIPLGDEVIEHHGVVNMYTQVTGSGGAWIEYEIKFTDGKVADVKRIYKEFG